MENLAKYRLLIGGGILLLLVVIGIVAFQGQQPDDGDGGGEGGDEASVPDIDADDVESLEIRRPGEEPIRLAKRNGSWRVVAPIDVPADQSAVTTALDKLTELELSGIAATKAANHERLEVDDEHGVRVIAKQGSRTLADFRLGAYRGGNTMLRMEGEQRVLAVRGSIKYAFNKPLRDWRNRSIVDIEPDHVTQLEVRNASGTFAFTKAGEDWQLGAGTTVARYAPSKVRALVSSLGRLRAVDFGEPNTTAATAGVSETTPSVTLHLRATDAGPAQQITLRLGNARGEGDREFYLVRDGDETVYVVSSFIADKLKSDTDDFQSPPDAGPGAAPPTPPEPPPDMPPMGMGGPGGGGQKIPPEIMEQIQRQLRQQGAAGGGHP